MDWCALHRSDAFILGQDINRKSVREGCTRRKAAQQAAVELHHFGLAVDGRGQAGCSVQ